ncbi:hypothetical protein AAFF_G00225790 [Aldrovandia affinis]|uniref:Borealin N-terminal domain-containing protein n=1 Tax=Aldrovandia affinis TaxID=143900 RepID=A0AAD7TB54_9TELE|nr:hypothetical protein AAFF_G00225790 [Aldrovandia affinis]
MESSKLKRVYQRSEGDLEGQLNKEQRDQKKKQLFMQQFEKEAQERIREMQSNMEQLLATVDRVFRVEMMKLPPQLQNTLLQDMMREDDAPPAGEVTIAVQAQSPEVHQPLTRKSSKKVQIRETATRKKRMLSVENAQALLKPSKKTPKSRSLADLSSAPKSTRASTSSIKRTRSRVAEVRDPAAVSASKGSTNAAGPSTSPLVTATILTSCGEPMCLSDDIDVAMLDETAVHQMQKLMQLLDYLCNKAKVNCQRSSDEA